MFLQNFSKFLGPDSLHPYVLKATAAELSPILTHLFKQSSQCGKVPSQWKHAYVTPMFKKGSKAHPVNHRPISLTSVFCKTMEHIIVSQIMKHQEDQNILTDKQFGFRSKHSYESQLLITINDIAKGIDINLQIDAAILKLLIELPTPDFSINWTTMVGSAMKKSILMDFFPNCFTLQGIPKYFYTHHKI